MSSYTPVRPRTLADAALADRADSLWTDLLLICGFAALTSVCAQISIPLPFTPVPITGQTFAVVLTGAALGARRGFLAMAMYLLWGAIGMPVFAGAAGGFARILGPTGGYLIAYPLAAAAVGALAEQNWDRRPWSMALSMVFANALIYIPGVLWLSDFVGGLQAALLKGLVPFIIGDAVKVVLASVSLPACWKFVNRQNSSH